MSEQRGAHSLEGIRITTETISGAELLKEIRVDGKADSHFLSKGRGGAFEFSFLRDLSKIYREESWYSIVRLNGLIVGIAEMILEPEGFLDLETVSIYKHLRGLRLSEDSEEREMRLSERLLEEVFTFARKIKCTIQIEDTFTSMGRQRLKHQIERLAAKHQDVPVDFL